MPSMTGLGRSAAGCQPLPGAGLDAAAGRSATVTCTGTPPVLVTCRFRVAEPPQPTDALTSPPVTDSRPAASARSGTPVVPSATAFTFLVAGWYGLRTAVTCCLPAAENRK